MHPEAYGYVAMAAARYGPFRSVLEIGGRDINGTVRPLFRNADYLSVDINPGPAVDVVADATTWRSGRRFDAVVCCEVLEHVAQPWLFIETAGAHLDPRGRLIVTAATDPRAPHSGIDGGPPWPGEHYANVAPEALKEWLSGWDDIDVDIDVDRGDVYATAVRHG